MPFFVHEKKAEERGHGRKGPSKNFRTIFNVVEKKTRFLSEKPYVQSVLGIEDFPYGQVVPCPGKKAFASPKKGGGPSFPNAGFRALLPHYPLPPASLCGKEEGGKWEGLIPALFVFGACSFARATRRWV